MDESYRLRAGMVWYAPNRAVRDSFENFGFKYWTLQVNCHVFNMKLYFKQSVIMFSRLSYHC